MASTPAKFNYSQSKDSNLVKRMSVRWQLISCEKIQQGSSQKHTTCEREKHQKVITIKKS